MSKLMLVAPSIGRLIPRNNKLAVEGTKVIHKLAQKSPEICIGAAVVCGVGATVMACRATLKVDAVLEEHKENREKIRVARQYNDAGELVTEYTEEDGQRDLFIDTVKLGVDLVKLYWPALVLGAASIGFMLGSHHIMMRRQATLTLAYESVKTAYDAYRQRVREQYGEEAEEDIYKGVTTKVEETLNAKGKRIKNEFSKLERPYSPYARIFDESSRFWKDDAATNKFFLATQQQHANDILRIRGYIFLNEVLEMLGIPVMDGGKVNSTGSICGWIYNSETGDGFVSFGMWDPTRKGTREFINEVERNIWLDFNVDGVIIDKI